MPTARTALSAVILLSGLVACRPAPPEGQQPALSITELLGGGDTSGFARAVAPRPFRFPADHGPHPDFQTEWWYFTGSLEATDPGAGRRFGYQLTFFRSALAPRGEAPRSEARESAWAAREVYMAHFAVTDPEDAGFRSHERFARAAGGLAGAVASPFRVWLEDWSAGGGTGSGPELAPIRLRAVEDGLELDLELAAGKPPVLQGERGLSRKGSEPGNASYYYSLTRLPTRGRLRLDGRSFAVRGASWMDREWSTSVLEEGIVGWDWFALQLDDGRELMLYRLRRADGSAAPASAGSLVEADGSARIFAGTEAEVEPLTSWTSPGSGRTYPASWRLDLPADGLELEVEPLSADQELRHSFVYWEGAVRCRGSRAGRPVSGYGYVELTGY